MKSIVLVAAALVLMASPAKAQPRNIRTCDIATTGIAFGLFSGVQIDRIGVISVTCDGTGNNIPVSIALSQGGANSFTPRQMSNGFSNLSYNLYIDPARTIIWGNGVGDTQLRFGSFDLRRFSPATETFTVFGQIPRQSLPRPGHYADLIVVTVFF